MSAPTVFPATDPDTPSSELDTAAADDLALILPASGTVLLGGYPVHVRFIRTKEALALARAVLESVDLSKMDLDPKADDFEDKLIGLVATVLPYAFDELLIVVCALVSPVNQEHAEAVATELDNPALPDLLDLFAVIVRQEAPNFRALWGKVQTLLKYSAALRKKQQTS